MNISKLIAQFLEHLEIEKGRSHNTIKNYDFYLKRFIKFVGDIEHSKIDQEIIRRYRLWLNRYVDPRTGESLTKWTQNYHLISLRSFLKYLAKIDLKTLSPEKIELAKTQDRLVDFLDQEEISRLLNAVLEANDKDVIKKRDRAILEVLFSAGLRVSEVVALKAEQINFKDGSFTVRGKGSKLRPAFLSESAIRSLKNYLAVRTDMNPYMFIGFDRAAKKRDSEDKESHLTPRSVERIVNKYAKLAGIMKDVHAHTLRHSFATDLLFNGADIRSVQALLGHASITTTQIYTHVTNPQLKEVHRAFHRRIKK